MNTIQQGPKEFFKLSEDIRLKMLDLPCGRVSAVLDTDTYNEIDDQFALAYSLLAEEKIELQAVYAAPFHNKRSDGPRDGMLKSYDEILRVFGRLNRNPESMVFKGSPDYLPCAAEPIVSPAAEDLITKASKKTSDDPLYVMSIGAPTNIASAILMKPDIIGKIVVVWLGGNPLSFHTAREFNLMQDIHASRILFDSGVPLIQIPCLNVSEHLKTTIHELEAFLADKNGLCDYLLDIFREFVPTSKDFPASKVIWDIAAPAILINHEWFRITLQHSPILTEQLSYSIPDYSRHFIRVVERLNRDMIFADMFARFTEHT